SGNIDEARAIADNIEANEQKINHHGKRADAIVKSMLQHSQLNKGEKEPTDVNSLTAEYLRLAYHGFRAKDKTFSANLETHFDPAIGNIDLVSKDIGRVLLNLFNNAFYTVSEKKKFTEQGYTPVIAVSTKKMNDKIEINIQDNGKGIPQQIIGKIFQPFFTTKPTGQGTGLGLSLSYDIIKSHKGNLIVETREGEGSEFIIQIPIV
ncbi:MAG TPA: HAMP domain-containing sensor histidine kinase, partial [Puia sp.]|nr:HAMP domain-containing sensor histidine kinase [Puia sp.]